MNCKLMIMPMRAGRRGKRKLKKRGEGLQMRFVRVNTCTYRMEPVNFIIVFPPRSHLCSFVVKIVDLEHESSSMVQHFSSSIKICD